MSLVTLSEIARQMGFSRQRAFAVAQDDPDFPAPVFDSPRRRMWDGAEIDRWSDLRRERTGRRTPRCWS